MLISVSNQRVNEKTVLKGAQTVEHNPKQIVESGYDRIAQRYLAFGQRNRAADASSARMTYLRKLLTLLPSQTEVLELGCGAGVPCTQLLAKQAHVTGVDISATQIALARQHVPNATLMQADMMALAFPPATFDAVVAFYSIIHLPRIEQSIILMRIAEWLRPDGCLLLNLGIADDPGSIEPDWLGTAMYWSSYDAQTYCAMLEQVGLTLVESEILSDDEDGEPVSFLWVLAKKEERGRP